MQTFLPYPSFEESAVVLDRQRLGKQRIEVKQILKTLYGYSDGWKNHPAVLMWQGCEHALAQYGWFICEEWKLRGYKDSCQDFILECSTFEKMEMAQMPFWFGDERFHSSHRAALLAKNYEWYSRFGWKEEPFINYFWP